MGFQSVVLLTVGLISCFSTVHGLKCYICDGTMDGCEHSVSSKPEYLVECEPHPDVMGCISFTVEILDFKNPFQRLLQRNCFYKFEAAVLGIHNHYLPHTSFRAIHFPFKTINKVRKDKSISPITKISTPTMISYSDSSNPLWVKVTACGPTSFTGDMNGCNDGDAEKVFPSTEGYPIDQHISWIKNIGEVKCYDCVTHNDTKESDVKACKSGQSSGHADHSSAKAYGCATYFVYQVAGVQNKPYFRRSVWYPGDSWCINKHFPSSPTGRSLVQYEYKNGRIEDDEESCERRYSRAFKERNSKALEESYIWAGTREFQTKEEYMDYLGCRFEVKRRLGIQFEIENYLFFENLDVQDNNPGPFASIGFHFCGPSDYCNGWSEERLHEVMKTNPTQKPIATKPTTLKPEVVKNNTGEVPWGGCEVEGGKNGGNDFYSFSVLGIFSILVPVASELHRLGL